ncbi:MAG: single-stranded DNA-binding protein [Verrucomicrobia bacterium]|nr:single-stranded DNA-binding protein [Verrucomicrobiota bacterium]
MSFGKGHFLGRLVKDSELTYSQDGKPSLKNAIAYDRYSASKQQKETSYINFIASGKTAENIQRYFQKGSLIYLTGDIEQIRWTDKATGQNKSAHHLIVREFDFCGSSNKPQVQGQQYQQQQLKQTPVAQPQQQQLQPESFDDVPF